VFRVLLPAAAQESATMEAPPAPTPAAAPHAAPLLHGRVLLVEDEPMVGAFMVDLLTAWGLEVVLERDPVAAAARLQAQGQPFDIMLTDQTMPRMTGLELARLAARHRPGLPTLLYTGNASEIAQEQLAECGVSALLRKPIDSAALRPVVRDLLAQADRAQAAAASQAG